MGDGLDVDQGSVAEVRRRVPRVAQHEAEQMPRARLTRASVVGSLVFVVSVVGFLYFVLPKLVGLKPTWSHLRQGNVWWLALAFVLETLSYFGYIWLFRGVFARDSRRIDWRVCLAAKVRTRCLQRLTNSAIPNCSMSRLLVKPRSRPGRSSSTVNGPLSACFSVPLPSQKTSSPCLTFT